MSKIQKFINSLLKPLIITCLVFSSLIVSSGLGMLVNLNMLNTKKINEGKIRYSSEIQSYPIPTIVFNREYYNVAEKKQIITDVVEAIIKTSGKPITTVLIEFPQGYNTLKEEKKYVFISVFFANNNEYLEFYHGKRKGKYPKITYQDLERLGTISYE